MKKIISLFLITLLGLSLCACKGNEKSKTVERKLYNIDFSKYITVGEYKGLKIDKSSDEYKQYLEEEYYSDVTNNNLYVTKNEGNVQKGDTANIDYVGKIDGVAFDGGTAQGYDLTIGSNNFIPGFEDGLIGAKIGSTVDLNLKFPDSYQNAEYAGKNCVFTVKINYVKTSDGLEPKDYYSDLGFNSLKDYEEDVAKRASKNLLIDTVYGNFKVNDYPAEELSKITGELVTFYDDLFKKNYNVDFQTVLSSENKTLDDFRETEVKPIVDEQIVLYYILDKENLKIDEEILKKQNLGSDILNETYAVQETVYNFIYDNAKIK